MDDATQTQLQAALARTNGFLPGALAANRAGRLTPEQARRLERKDRSDRLLLALVGLVVIVGVGLYLGWEVSHRGLQVLRDQGGAYVGLAVGSLLVGLGGFWREYQTDLARAEVHMVEGRGTKAVTATEDGPPSYSYSVGSGVGASVDFEVSEKAYEVFVEGVYYRAYYLPYSGRLINIEVLRPEERPASTGLPTCPVCGRSDRVSHILADDPFRSERRGCSELFFPFNLILPLLQGRNLLREGQERQARHRARLAMLARRPPLYQCRRDQVVFVPGTGKAVPIRDMVRWLQEGDDPERIAQIFEAELHS